MSAPSLVGLDEVRALVDEGRDGGVLAVGRIAEVIEAAELSEEQHVSVLPRRHSYSGCKIRAVGTDLSV